MRMNTLVLTVVVALCTASVMRAQPASTRIGSVSAYAPVTSASYSGTIVVGLPLVGFIQDPVVHGHWGWPVLATLSVSSIGTVDQSDVVVQPGSTVNDLRVVDHMGRLVRSDDYAVMADGTVDLSRVTSGVYTVMEIHDTTVKSHRILIVR